MLTYHGSCYPDYETTLKAVCDNMPLVSQNVIYSCTSNATTLTLNAVDSITNQTNTFTLQPSFNECLPDMTIALEYWEQLLILPVIALAFMYFKRVTR